jgi:hypothetical protein
MGYIRHHAIVVTASNEDDARSAHDEAERIFGCTTGVVTSLCDPVMNGYISFAVLPDGSKEGWEESDDGDAARNRLIAWLESEATRGVLDWAEVQFGDDNGEQIVTRASGMARNG